MAKKNRQLKWHEHLFLSLINFCLAVFIAFRGFSYLIGNRSYAEIGSSKNSGIGYAFSKLEQTDWRFLVVAFFMFLSWLMLNEGITQLRKLREK